MAIMQMAVLKEFPRLAAGTAHDLNLLVRLEFPAPPESTKRPPIHLALVLDRSGSMEGEKLALTKQAAVFFMNWLTRRDFLTVVVYDDTVRVLVPHTPLTDKRAIAERIGSISSGGQTNLSGGWMRGLAELQEHYEKGHLHRLVLLTDGQANVGATTAEQLNAIAVKSRDRDIVTTAVGFGADFDERILKGIAEGGGGRFHYVKEAEGLAKAFQDEFGELAAIVAQNVELQLELNEGVTIADVLTDMPCERTQRTLQVRLGDARGGDVKVFLARLAVAGTLCAHAGDAALGALTARCDALVGDMLSESRKEPLQVAVAEGGDAPQPDAEVRREVWLAESARLKLTAARHLGAAEGAQAAGLLRRHADAAQELAKDPAAQIVRDEIAQLRELAGAIDANADSAEVSKTLTHTAVLLSGRRGAYRQQAGLKKLNAVVPKRRPEEALDVIAAVEKEAAARGFEAERINRVRLVLRELLDNALEHGCANRPDAVVRVECHISESYARMIVADDGPGFDHAAKLQEEQDKALAPGKRGRGLLLIAKLADRSDWQTANGTRVEAVVERRGLQVATEHAPHSMAGAHVVSDTLGIEREVHAERGTVILRLRGQLDSHTCAGAEQAMHHLFVRGYYKLIVDLSEVEYISSAGAGVFIAALGEAQEHGGNIVLLSPTPNVRAVFATLGLTQTFHICDDLPSAYAAF